MSKKQNYLRSVMEDAKYIDQIYSDKNLEQFNRLLIDRLLSHIVDISFRQIINDHLQGNVYFCGSVPINSYLWRYTADLKLINSWITYTFRFPNACYSGLYNKFDVDENHLFKLSSHSRHRSNVWYRYHGQKLLHYIGEYLDITSIFDSKENPHTMLFVNQEERRVDINFYFASISTKITITFENGTPL